MAKRNTYFEDEVVHKKIDIKQFGRILKYIMPYKHIFIIVCVLMLVSACTALLPPMLLRYVINDVVVEKSMAKLFYVVCGLCFSGCDGYRAYLCTAAYDGTDGAQCYCGYEKGYFL